MNYEICKYVARAIVRHLNGDRGLFYTYTHQAMKIQQEEKCIVSLEELIDENIRAKLYMMVS